MHSQIFLRLFLHIISTVYHKIITEQHSYIIICIVSAHKELLPPNHNNMWFLDSAPSEWKDIWNNLMKEAQRVYIEAKDNMVMYQYYLIWR